MLPALNVSFRKHLSPQHVALAFPELVLCVFFNSSVQASLSTTNLVFLGTKDITVLDYDFKKFVKINFPVVGVDFNTIDVLVFLWLKSRDAIDKKLKHDNDAAATKHEKNQIMLGIIGEAQLLLEDHQGKIFTRRQGEFILAAVKDVAKLGANLSKLKKAGFVPQS